MKQYSTENSRNLCTLVRVVQQLIKQSSDVKEVHVIIDGVADIAHEFCHTAEAVLGNKPLDLCPCCERNTAKIDKRSQKLVCFSPDCEKCCDGIFHVRTRSYADYEIVDRIQLAVYRICRHLLYHAYECGIALSEMHTLQGVYSFSFGDYINYEPDEDAIRAPAVDIDEAEIFRAMSKVMRATEFAPTKPDKESQVIVVD